MNNDLACQRTSCSPYDRFSKEAFTRLDESDDSLFYARDRFVQHLDSVALSTVEWVLGRLIREDEPVILDLMAGWDSHIPATVRPAKVVGLGLNRNELSQNPALDDFVVHDLNQVPKLPFPDNFFDAVINTVSVDYMTKPFEVFGEVERILKPGGVFVVIFSNRMFVPKATRVWQECSESIRVDLVRQFFDHTEGFGPVTTFVSSGKPRPREDKYAHLGVPSDPIYVLYAEKEADELDRKLRPDLSQVDPKPVVSEEEMQKRMYAIKDTLCCPHCGEKMNKWAVPDDPFSTWMSEFMYICFNDTCSYFTGGWAAMNRQGNQGSYRFVYDPERESCMPIPVLNLDALRDGIVE